MPKSAKIAIEFLLASLVFICIIISIRFTGLDLIVSDTAHNITTFNSTMPLKIAAWMGKYFSVIFCGIVIIILPWLWKTNHKFKKEALFAVVLLAVGPGFMSNFLFKPHFKRPRPQQIERYRPDSAVKFLPALSPGENITHKSFPSGHAGAAFFFIFPWLCLRLRQKYGLKLIIPGLIFGLLTGAVRILEGKHFLSDIIASLAVVYLTGLIIAFLFFRNSDALENTPVEDQ